MAKTLQADQFLTIHAQRMDWQADSDVLTLPKGVEIKMLRNAPEEGRRDLLIRFPPGYHEPEHTHDSSHAVVCLEGKQIVGGEVMLPGEYVYGPANIPHGPFDYPEGCVVFASFSGQSAQHRWSPE